MDRGKRHREAARRLREIGAHDGAAVAEGLAEESATEILERARAREEARAAAYRPIDYDRMNRESRRLKAALTRAVNSGDRDRVVIACAEAVRVWDEVGAWPDQWSTWQVALDDAFPVFAAPRLEDLRRPLTSS